jgi:hypothetical protein
LNRGRISPLNRKVKNLRMSFQIEVI